MNFSVKMINLERRIVCAAARHANGRIVCSPRHMDETCWKQILNVPVLVFDGKLPPKVEEWQGCDQGFINSWGEFLTREEAWIVALHNKQIIKDLNWQIGCLHSEHLY
jgi:hypothetical protein